MSQKMSNTEYDFDRDASAPRSKRFYEIVLRDPISIIGLSAVGASFWWGIWKGIQGEGAKSTNALGGRAMMQAATLGTFASGVVLVRYLQKWNQTQKVQPTQPAESVAAGGY